MPRRLFHALFILTLGLMPPFALGDVMQAVDTSAAGTSRSALAQDKPVTAKQAMVVTAQHLATKVGKDILAAGGNAIDAAVAIGYAEAVVHPCCGNLGGGGFMTLQLANGESRFLDFREKAPAAASATMFTDDAGQLIPDSSTDSYLAVGVPGTVMGLNTALETYGSMSLAEVMQPAIKLAQEGFELTPGDITILQRRTDDFAQEPNVAAIFLNQGQAWQAGEKLIQTDLAKTLKTIAKNGTAGFYEGPIAQAIVDASRQHDGILTMDDFADYTVAWRDPVTCNYRDYRIVAAPPPSSGGVALCQILGMLEPWPLAEWGYGTSTMLHHLAEAERRAFADRNTYLGDPDFVHNPIQQLLQPSHLDAMRASIDADKATPSSAIHGSLPGTEGTDTTHYSVMDAAGNAVSVTYTINYLFGNGRIAGDTGFFLNNEMDDFTAKPGEPNAFGLIQGSANKIEPGKRPLSSMTPTIVLDENQPFIITGSPGGATIISTVVQSIINLIDFGMNAQQAVNAPRMHHQWWPDTIHVEPGLLSDADRKALEAMGHALREVDSWGAAEVIVRDPQSGVLQGANDRRRPAGQAAGY